MERINYIRYIFLAVLILSVGCSDDQSVEPVADQVLLEGKVYNTPGYEEIFVPGAALNGASVDIFNLSSTSPGNKLNKNSVVTDSLGKFRILANKMDSGEYLVVAKKNNYTYRALVNTRYKSEVTTFVQPVLVMSTAQADIFMEMKTKDFTYTHYDISLLVNDRIAENLSDNKLKREKLSYVLNHSLEARNKAFRKSYFGGSQAGLDSFNDTAEEIHQKYSRDLHFAKSESAVKTIVNSFYESYLDAFESTGLSRSKITQLQQVYHYINDKNNLEDDELKLEFIKSNAYLKAKTLTQNHLSGLQTLNASSKYLLNAKSAAKKLTETIMAAQNSHTLKSAFNNYNKEIYQAAIKTVKMRGNLRNEIERRVMSGLNKMESELSGNSSPDAVINSYIKFYSTVTPDVMEYLKETYNKESEIIADILVSTYLNL
jgi:hypothetical protein